MKNNTLNFSILALLTLLLNILSKDLLNIEQLINNSLVERLTHEQIDNILDIRGKFSWLEYVASPLLLLIKIAIISAIIDASCFFFDKKVPFKRIFNIVTTSEFIFLFAALIKLIWFYNFNQDYTLEDIQTFYPLSALNITGYDNISPWFIYPFQVINLFELAYFIILSYLLGKELKMTMDKSLSIVVGGYGICLVIWVIGVMFFTLNMS